MSQSQCPEFQDGSSEDLTCPSEERHSFTLTTFLGCGSLMSNIDFNLCKNSGERKGSEEEEE